MGKGRSKPMGTKRRARGGTVRPGELKRGGKGGRESERPIVLEKRGNRPHWDPVEGRGRWITELLRGKMTDALKSELISTGQRKIAELARRAPGLSFTSLNHYLDMDWMREAYRRTRKDGAVGVD